jgi:uncharacterized protein
MTQPTRGGLAAHLGAVLLSLGSLSLCHGAAFAQAAAPSSPAKKELVAKVVQLSQPGVEFLARGLVEQPAAQFAQQLSLMLRQVPADKREALGRELQSDLRRYVEQTVPVVRERALRVAPGAIGPVLEEKLTEAELRQLVAMLESPIHKKYNSLAVEIQRSLAQKLAEESRPVLQERSQALQQSLLKRFNDAGVPVPGQAASPAGR